MAYATLADLKANLGITNAVDDMLLQQYLDHAQAYIEGYTGRVFEAPADETREYSASNSAEAGVLYLDADLCQIARVVNGDGEDVTSVVSALPAHATPYYALVIPGAWTGTVSVTGRWAYSLTAPGDIVHATLRLAAYMYRQKDAQVFDVVAVPDAGVITVPQGIPADVRLILERYRRRV